MNVAGNTIKVMHRLIDQGVNGLASLVGFNNVHFVDVRLIKKELIKIVNFYFILTSN